MNWKDFFDSLGMNGTRWQWRIVRWQERWEARKTAIRQKRGQVTYAHKFCSCGALLDRNERECHRCGKRAPSWRLQVIARACRLVMPSGPAVSHALLLANALAFLLLLVWGGSRALLMPDLQLLARMGGLVLARLPEGGQARLITYGYLHFGLLHFAFNMLVLSQVGPLLEREIGKARFFTLYTLALVGGGLARYAVSGPVPTLVVGASGALFGLIGFGMAYAHFIGTPSALDMRNFFARWALYGFLFGFVVGADNVAHVGGFVVGTALGWLIERERMQRDRYAALWTSTATVSVMLTVFAFAWVAFGLG
jgi:rhomboid protease GluP